MHEQAIKRAVTRLLVENFHCDANETAFLQRELEQVRAKVLAVDYPELKGRRLFPMATDIAPSADTYIYRVTDRVGRARVIANASDDLPRVEATASERSGSVKLLGDSYGWNIMEMQEAARLGMPLNTLKANAANEAIEFLIEDLLATGQDPSASSTANTALAVPGFLTNADIANGAGAANSRVVALSHWVLGTTTGQDIVDDLNRLVVAVPDGSEQVYTADTVVLPPREYNIAALTRMNDFDARSALQAFLQASPWIRSVDSWRKCTGVGVDGKSRAVAYRRTADVVESVIPMDFTQLPPQARNLDFVVPCLARCGGVKVYKPLACAYGDFDAS